MDEKSLVDIAIKQGRRTINLGLLVMLFCMMWFVQNKFYPNAFSGEDHLSSLDSLNKQMLEGAMFEIDSTNVKDGIHLPTGLIVDDGCQEVMTTCGACHSLDLVTQNRATREGWKDIIVWMQETQELWDLGEKEDVILDYLAKNYAPENSGRRKNLENVEWYSL
ncbi:MAG: hypothetical protein ACI857_001843 [Arenicella sp.]|jgi:hypothetical protein